MPLQKLSLDDNLGNNTSHLFKSGNVLRRDEELDDLVRVRKMLPKFGPRRTRIEYDVWYDMNDKRRIHGYTYTDVMQKFVMLRVCSNHHSLEHIKSCIEARHLTDEGIAVYEDIANDSQDKYRLKKAHEQYDNVIFLPGGNVYGTIVDEDKVAKAIKEEGAMLKLHPITPKTMASMLGYKFGRQNLIDKKISGNTLLQSCKKVYTCYNSEMGLVGMIKGKEFGFIGKDTNEPSTYKHIYDALLNQWEIGELGEDDSIEMRFKWLFSAPNNGLISIKYGNPQEKINNFFKHWKDWPHVPPKNIDT